MRLLKFTTEFTMQVNNCWKMYELQAGTLCDWFMYIEEPLKKVITVGISYETELFKCNEILKAISDSWDNLCANPTRGDVEDDAKFFGSGTSIDLFGVKVCMKTKNLAIAWAYVWINLLTAHARPDVDKSILLQCVKDAVDNDVFETVGVKHEDIAPALRHHKKEKIEALQTILNEGKWAALPSTRKHYPMRTITGRMSAHPLRIFDDYDEYMENLIAGNYDDY
eukprot:g3666.t1